MRVVLDTNILISACWKPGGLEARTVQLVIDGAISACVTAPVWLEYREVLSRDKFAALRNRSEPLVTALDPIAIRVEPADRVFAAGDEDDNRFLECASASQADYLITGNLKHYPSAWGRTKIVSARQFLGTEFGEPDAPPRAGVSPNP